MLVPGDSSRDIFIPLEVTFSPFQKVTFSPSRKGHQQNCQVKRTLCFSQLEGVTYLLSTITFVTSKDSTSWELYRATVIDLSLKEEV